MTLKLVAGAVACLGAALAVGALVAHRAPGALDRAGVALRGYGVPLALFFTALGRWWVVTPIGILAFGIGMVLQTNLVPVIALLAAQAGSQGSNALLKRRYHRQRPDAFLGVREPDLSFPSGHAVTSIVFFLGLALLAWHAPLPRPVAVLLTVAFAIGVAGIPWSRLALGAHYATDVIGGILFGGAWLLAALALIVYVDATAAATSPTAVR